MVSLGATPHSDYWSMLVLSVLLRGRWSLPVLWRVWDRTSQSQCKNPFLEGNGARVFLSFPGLPIFLVPILLVFIFFLSSMMLKGILSKLIFIYFLIIKKLFKKINDLNFKLKNLFFQSNFSQFIYTFLFLFHKAIDFFYQ